LDLDLSDSDEAVDAGSNEEIRMIFAISGSPISGSKKPSLLGVFAATTKVQCVGKSSLKYVLKLLNPESTTPMRIFLWVALTGFLIFAVARF
jgi:hypothetical protein